MTRKKVLGCIRKADEEFNLIQDGDKVCVGVSGGKDSMLLLYCLSLYKKFATVKFDVIGVHIEMGFPNMDFSEADAFCKKNGIISWYNLFYGYNFYIYKQRLYNPKHIKQTGGIFINVNYTAMLKGEKNLWIMLTRITG